MDYKEYNPSKSLYETLSSITWLLSNPADLIRLNYVLALLRKVYILAYNTTSKAVQSYSLYLRMNK